MSDVYGLKERRVSEGYKAIMTPFTQNLIQLAKDQSRKGVLATFIPNNILARRGELAKTGMLASERTVLDINNLVTLENHALRNVQEEITYYVQETVQGLPLMLRNNKELYLNKKDLLTNKYLLESFVCYVEVYEGGSQIDKFIATRSTRLLDTLVEIPKEKVYDINSTLQMSDGDYINENLPVIGINVLKKGYGFSRGRKLLKVRDSAVRVTPIFLLEEFFEGLKEVLTDNVLKIKYVKDNLTEREIITTMNVNALMHFYSQTHLYTILQNVGSNANRGYVMLPMIGLSKYDKTGVRAVNIGRITSIERVNINSEEVQNKKRFIDTDLTKTILHFSNAIQGVFDINVLRTMYTHVSNNQPPQAIQDNIALLKTDMVSTVETNYENYGTTYLEWLHDYMMMSPKLFSKYIEYLERINTITLRDGQ